MCSVTWGSVRQYLRIVSTSKRLPPFPTSCGRKSLSSPAFAFSVAQDNVEIHASFTAIDCDLDRVASAVIVHHTRNVAGIVDVLSIDGDDQVTAEHYRDIAKVSTFSAALQARAFSRSARNHALNEQAIIHRQAQLLCQLRSNWQ